jgi:hypothetical protein
MTGTRSLNSPEMLKHENDIAYYLKQILIIILGIESNRYIVAMN